ncbi:MAG: Stp1/IreP family PP2C-type Ser/Thr phosphatase [Anaerolineae bacterium]|nr:Stp1/IreP family PP2C-type Ser/Thr phosphatase [Anaerolineae bacterium]
MGYVSHEGLKRPHNEDSLLIFSLPGPDESGLVQLYVVADGAGGMASGKLASSLTVSAVKDAVTHTSSNDSASSYTDWLQTAVQQANQTVFDQSRQDRKKMASTLVMVLIEDDKAYVANVGDSRAYLFDEFGPRQITEDHSAAQELLKAGLITKDEVKGHPFEHILTRAIGPEENVEPDLFTERVQPGDRLLLCSDGLTNMVTDDEIWDIVWNTRDLTTAAQQLIDAANAAGGKDNITALVIQILR